jgi:hypothetical protein
MTRYMFLKKKPIVKLCTQFSSEQKVAGAGGFEPPNAGTKILCLTA